MTKLEALRRRARWALGLPLGLMAALPCWIAASLAIHSLAPQRVAEWRGVGFFIALILGLAGLVLLFVLPWRLFRCPSCREGLHMALNIGLTALPTSAGLRFCPKCGVDLAEKTHAGDRQRASGSDAPCSAKGTQPPGT